MPPNKDEWMRRVKSVEREHTAVRYAADYLLNFARHDPSDLSGELRIRDIGESIDRLEGTYIVRLFAEFEACLRRYWNASRNTKVPLRTRDLINSVAARRRIPNDQITHAHEVRAYRNALIHEGSEVVSQVPISSARAHLCRFLSFLPWNGKKYEAVYNLIKHPCSRAFLNLR